MEDQQQVAAATLKLQGQVDALFWLLGALVPLFCYFAWSTNRYINKQLLTVVECQDKQTAATREQLAFAAEQRSKLWETAMVLNTQHVELVNALRSPFSGAKRANDKPN